MLNHTGANESSKRGKKSKNQKNLFYSEGSELFLQHIIGDCLLNYDTRKKINKTYKIYHSSFSAVLGFWVWWELHQYDKILYLCVPLYDAEFLTKHCCRVMCSTNPFWDQTIGSCNKPVISIFVLRQLVSLGEWKNSPSACLKIRYGNICEKKELLCCTKTKQKQGEGL